MEQHPLPITRRAFKRKSFSPVKLIFVVLWGLFLLLNTWTKSLEQFIDFQSISFQWNPHPNFAGFFYFGDFTLIHEDFVAVKLGHFVGFAIFDLLVYWLLKNHPKAVVVSFVFAFLTEFFQLYLGRDGRLYDLGIDTFGIISVYLIVSLKKAFQQNSFQ